MITELMNNPTGRIIVSLILGFGLAALFRQVCKGDECHIIKPPNLEELKKYYYKIDGECYKYTPYATKCDAPANAGEQTRSTTNVN